MPGNADLHSFVGILSECPAPVPCECPPQVGWDAELEVPGSSWSPGSVVRLEIRPGLVNGPGGGLCGIMRGEVTDPSGAQSEVALLSQPANCIPIPEPPVSLMLTTALVSVACCVGGRKALSAFLGRSSTRPARHC